MAMFHCSCGTTDVQCDVYIESIGQSKSSLSFWSLSRSQSIWTLPILCKLALILACSLAAHVMSQVSACMTIFWWKWGKRVYSTCYPYNDSASWSVGHYNTQGHAESHPKVSQITLLTWLPTVARWHPLPQKCPVALQSLNAVDHLERVCARKKAYDSSNGLAYSFRACWLSYRLK